MRSLGAGFAPGVRASELETACACARTESKVSSCCRLKCQRFQSSQLLSSLGGDPSQILLSLRRPVLAGGARIAVSRPRLRRRATAPRWLAMPECSRCSATVVPATFSLTTSIRDHTPRHVATQETPSQYSVAMRTTGARAPEGTACTNRGPTTDWAIANETKPNDRQEIPDRSGSAGQSASIMYHVPRQKVATPHATANSCMRSSEELEDCLEAISGKCQSARGAVCSRGSSAAPNSADMDRS
mmetsp:Transcript_31509/g.73377  ORF Transcript_31509/g.73377 Transcript_31509/m.73377 type:complete len:244 (-) Transcript_31509:70-801(-)